MDLATLITQTEVALTTAQAGNWSGCAAILNAPTVERKDSTPRTSNWISTQLSVPMPGGQPGETKADRVLGTIKTVGAKIPRIDAAYHSLCSGGRDGGIDLSLPLTQEMIDLLGVEGHWGDELIADIKSRGVWHVSPATAAGLDPVTADQCEAAGARHQRAAAVASAMNEIVNPALANSDNTAADVAAAFRAAADILDPQ